MGRAWRNDILNSGKTGKTFDEWNIFLENYVFGERYIEIIGKDEWYELLREQQII